MINDLDKRLKQLLDYDLTMIFSEKQIELLYAKLENKKMSKTEEEYFSRVIKKKLAALLNPDLQNIARVLTR